MCDEDLCDNGVEEYENDYEDDDLEYEYDEDGEDDEDKDGEDFDDSDDEDHDDHDDDTAAADDDGDDGGVNISLDRSFNDNFDDSSLKM